MLSESNRVEGGTSNYREKLAGLVLALGFGALLVLAAVAIYKEPANSITIFNTVLPMIATWVGTVLAFYFSKDNFEAANRAVQTVALSSIEGKLSSKSVTSVMRKRGNIVAKSTADPQLETTTIDELLKWMEGEGRGGRLLILGAKDEPELVVHRSSLESYLLRERAQATAGGAVLDKFGDFLKHENNRSKFRDAVGVVPEGASLADAKREMDQVAFRQDVVVTRTGRRTEPVLGWITNNTIEEEARV